MGKNKTHAEYVKELAEKNPNIEVLGIYCGSNIKIPHRCKIDGNTWNVTPSNILRGGGCPECNIKKKRKTHEEYVKELAGINPNIEVIEEYRGLQVNIMHYCLIHNFEWSARPGNLLQGRGCPKCANNIKKTHNDYLNELYIKDIDIIPLEEYKGANTPILHLCKISVLESIYFSSGMIFTFNISNSVL